MAADKYHCVGCRKNVVATSENRYRKHDRTKGEECARSRRDIPTWLLRRGPETAPDDVRPVVGRDYAPCPECERSPQLDLTTGFFVDHVRSVAVPAEEREQCPMSGKPYEPPNESEEMISKWAKAAAEATASREVPPPFPESTTTPPGSPQSPDEVAAPPETSSAAKGPAARSANPEPCYIAGDHGPHPWVKGKRQARCPGKPAPTTAATAPVQEEPPAEAAADAREAAPSSTTSLPPPAPTPESTPAERAAPAPAGVRERTELPPEEHTTTDAQLAKVAAVVEKRAAAPTPTASGPTEAAAALNAATDAATSTPDAAPSTAATPPTRVDAPPSSEPRFAQPGSPFAQPGKVEPAPAAAPMTVEAKQLVARMRELFFQYVNRKTEDNRGAQATLGPSEIGTPCDRQLAMSLLRIPAVNPGGDGWAAFKGTAVHEALAGMFQWADGGTGRFAVEVPLKFPTELVPRGTTDLLDRILFMIDDHKIQGRWSQEQLRTKGMTPKQRVQLHVYGYGARLQGERVDQVALLSWPMESSSLDDMYAVIEPYDPAVARDALARVDKIAEATQGLSTGENAIPALEVASYFAVADDCRYCPFYAPGDAHMERGCNGRQ
ncbi:hypothetical protein [Streptomyces sp. NPDC046925]|uniref:hypothetical protein n=1 Tax=Streptomyces sp. NPDC046925 TaxID=3155375 RepID=UPI0033FA03A0